MEKQYEKPIIEKVSFDYKIQTSSNSDQKCFGSIINVKTDERECGEGTPSYVGWNKKNPGEI